jgi:predicted nuclease of predicted toxin-antitoxin system
MRFLLDQDVYAMTGRFLNSLGHDVVFAGQLGMAQAADEQLLEVAGLDHRILVTRDRDYGNLVFVKGIRVGVLYLRMSPEMQAAVHDELGHVLKSYREVDLQKMFVVVEPGRHRIRRFHNS